MLRRICKFILALAITWPGASWAALAVDAHGKGTVGISTPHDESITLNASATQLFVGLTYDSAVTVTSVTWDQGGTNQAMTQIATANSSSKQSYLFGLKSPTTGTKTLRVVYSGSPGGGDQVFWVSFTGGDTTTGWRTGQTRTNSNGTGPGLTDANWTSGDYEVHVANVLATTIAFDAGETAQQSNNIAGSGFSGGLSYDASDGTVGCTDQTTYSEVAVAVIPASGGGGGTARTLMLMGVGP